MTYFEISFDWWEEKISVKESFTSDSMNGFSVLLSLCFKCFSYIYLSVTSMFSTMVADREFTRFTVIFIYIARMSHTDLLCWGVVYFISTSHNIMVYCFRSFTCFSLHWGHASHVHDKQWYSVSPGHLEH